MATITETPGMIVRRIVADELNLCESSILPFSELPGLTPQKFRKVMTRLRAQGLKFPNQLEGITCINDLYRTQEKLKGGFP